MRKTCTRGICSLLALLMVFSMLPVQALAVETTDEPVVQSQEGTWPTEEQEPIVATEAETTAPTEVSAPAQTEPLTQSDASADAEAVMEQAGAEAEITVTTATAVAEAGDLSSEELFAGYVGSLFYGGVSTYGTLAGDELTGDTRRAYDALLPVLRQIANGQRASTTIAVGKTLSSSYVAEVDVDFESTSPFPKGGTQLGTLLRALLADLPYELYWFDKTAENALTATTVKSGSNILVTFEFTVGGRYSGAEAYTVDTGVTGAASTAASNAQTVLDAAAGKSDYDKLVYFRDWICEHVSYDDTSAETGNFSENIDPWQLIYVFDGDSSTNVVCEGYSKAFQYLCDEAGLTCRLVWGDMTAPDVAGGHMWNIVTLDGQNYLVDVTNSDTGTSGADGSLFLAGGAPNEDGSYTFADVTFTYDENMASLYGDTALTLATESYDPSVGYEDQFIAAMANGERFFLEQDLTLTRDVTIPEGSLVSPWGGHTLTVSEGVTLTVNGQLMVSANSHLVVNGTLVNNRSFTVDFTATGATFTVGSTGVLENNNYVRIGNGSTTFKGTYIAGANASFNLDTAAQFEGIDKVGKGNVWLSTLVDGGENGDDAELVAAVAMDYAFYNGRSILINGNITLAEDLTIPGGMVLQVGYSSNNSEGVQYALTIGEGATLTIEGTVSSQSFSGIYVASGGTMKVNASYASVRLYCPLVVQPGGTVQLLQGNMTAEETITTQISEDGASFGLIQLGEGTLTVNGTLDNQGVTTIGTGPNNNYGTVNVNGTVNNSGSLYIAYGATGAVLLVNEAGALNNTGFLYLGSGYTTVNGTFTHSSEYLVIKDSSATVVGIDAQYIEEDQSYEDQFIAAMTNGETFTLTEDLHLTTNVYTHDGAVINAVNGAVLYIEPNAAFVNHSGNSVTINCDVVVGTDEPIAEGQTAGELTAGTGVLTINGSIITRANGWLWIDGDGTLNQYGSMTLNGCTFVGYDHEDGSRPGTLNIYADALNYGYFVVASMGVLNVMSGGSLENVARMENAYPEMPTSGTINVFGSMVNRHMIRLESSATLNLLEGGTLTNYHIIDAWHGGTMDASGGTYTEYGVFADSQEGAIMAAIRGGSSGITLDEDLTLQYLEHIPAGFTVTIPANVTMHVGTDLVISGGLVVEGTLVNDAWLTVDSTAQNAALTVAQGATVQNNCAILVNNGTLDFQGTYSKGASATFLLSSAVSATGVENIGKENIDYDVIVSTEDELRAAMAETGYKSVYARIDDNIALTEDLTIPENMEVVVGGVASTGSTLTVNGGVTLTINGELFVLEYTTLEVLSGGTLNNQGLLKTSSYSQIVIRDGGKFVNNGSCDGFGDIIFENTMANFATAMEFGKGFTLTEDLVVTSDVDLNDGASITTENGAKLIVPNGVTLHALGNVTINCDVEIQVGGRMDAGYLPDTAHGAVTFNGHLTIAEGGLLWTNGGSVTLNGTADVWGHLFAGFTDDLVSASGTITVNGTLNIPGDENSNGYLAVNQGSTLHVTSTGVVNNDGYIDHRDATIIVDGTLNDNFLFTIAGGSVTVNGTFTRSENADLVGLKDDGSGPATVTGIDRSHIRYEILVSNSDVLCTHLTSMEGYAEKMLKLNGDVTLSQGITIPADYNGVITNAEGGAYTLIVGPTGSLSGRGSLVVECPVEVQSGGSVMCEGAMTFNADVTIDGSMATVGQLVLNGSVTNNGVLHAGFTGENNASVPGSLDVNGTLTNNAYLAVHEGATLNINAGASVVNPVKTDDNYPFIDNAGTINVYGELENNYQLSLGNPEGTGNAVVNVNEGGTLTNNHILDVCGGGAVAENGGTYNQNGVYVYDVISSIEAAMLNGMDTWELSGDLVIDRALEISEGFTLTSPANSGYTLTIAADGWLGAYGAVKVENLVIEENGFLAVDHSGDVEVTKVTNYGVIDIGITDYDQDGNITREGSGTLTTATLDNMGRISMGTKGILNVTDTLTSKGETNIDQGAEATVQNLIVTEGASVGVHSSLTVRGNATVYQGCEIYIEDSARMDVEGDLDNSGQISVTSGGELYITGDLINQVPTSTEDMTSNVYVEGILVVSGTLDNYGQFGVSSDAPNARAEIADMIVRGGSNLYVGGVLNLTGHGSVEPDGLLWIEGTMNVSGTLENSDYIGVDYGGVLDVSGTVTNLSANESGRYSVIDIYGEVLVSGKLDNQCEISMYVQEGAATGGVLNIAKGGVLENNYMRLNAGCSVNVSGTMNNNGLIEAYTPGQTGGQRLNVLEGGVYNENGYYLDSQLDGFLWCIENIDGQWTWSLDEDMVIDIPVTIPAGSNVTITNMDGSNFTVTIAKGGSITVEDGATLTLECDVLVKRNGELTVDGQKVICTGTLTIEDPIPVPARPYKITNVISGVHVYWRAVEGSTKYGVWRSETGKDGTYKWLGNPAAVHFTDTTAESGKTYYYRITAMDGTEHSEMSEAIGIAFVSTPDITSRTNIAAGVKLGWNKIIGATGYAIYRKSYDGTDAWVRVATISGNSNFSWTDESVKNNNGQVYRYTVRALAGANMATLSGCRPDGRTMVRLSSQVLKSVVKASATSAKCTWTTSSRVTGYEIRFIVGNTVYKTFTVGNYKTGVKTFTGLPTGQTYTVQVRTYKKVDGVGSFYSDWSTAKTVTLK